MTTPLERARQAVLRELRNPTEWVDGDAGMTDRESEQLVDHLIEAVRRHDAETVPPRHPEGDLT